MTEAGDGGSDGDSDGGGQAAENSDGGGQAVDDSDGRANPLPNDGEAFECPNCDESLPADARFCPSCATAIDAEGEPVDLSDLDGFDADGQPEFLEVEDGERRATGRVRALTGMAVAIPLAPLVLFLVNAVTPLTVWTAPVVFLVGWFVCGAALSRARVPIEAFGRSLYLLAVGTALVPVAVAYGSAGFALDTAGSEFRIIAVASVVIAGILLVMGRYVTQQGRRRVTGERRAFENAREE